MQTDVNVAIGITLIAAGAQLFRRDAACDHANHAVAEADAALVRCKRPAAAELLKHNAAVFLNFNDLKADLIGVGGKLYALFVLARALKIGDDAAVWVGGNVVSKRG